MWHTDGFLAWILWTKFRISQHSARATQEDSDNTRAVGQIVQIVRFCTNAPKAQTTLPYIEISEDLRHTKGNKDLYDKRKETIERLFGTAKEHHVIPNLLSLNLTHKRRQNNLQFENHIKSESLVLIPVLYLIGTVLKNSKIQDKWIPLCLGFIGVTLSALWLFATEDIANIKEVFISIFTAITRGILIAGASVYANQMYKQLTKGGEDDE